VRVEVGRLRRQAKIYKKWAWRPKARTESQARSPPADLFGGRHRRLMDIADTTNALDMPKAPLARKQKPRLAAGL
jgi:hypothetical protein